MTRNSAGGTAAATRESGDQLFTALIKLAGAARLFESTYSEVRAWHGAAGPPTERDYAPWQQHVRWAEESRRAQEEAWGCDAGDACVLLNDAPPWKWEFGTDAREDWIVTALPEGKPARAWGKRRGDACLVLDGGGSRQWCRAIAKLDWNVARCYFSGAIGVWPKRLHDLEEAYVAFKCAFEEASRELPNGNLMDLPSIAPGERWTTKLGLSLGKLVSGVVNPIGTAGEDGLGLVRAGCPELPRGFRKSLDQLVTHIAELYVVLSGIRQPARRPNAAIDEVKPLSDFKPEHVAQVRNALKKLGIDAKINSLKAECGRMRTQTLVDITKSLRAEISGK